MADLVPERGMIAVEFKGDPGMVRQITEAQLGRWCAMIGEDEVFEPDSFRTKVSETILQRRFGAVSLSAPFANTQDKFEVVAEATDHASSTATRLLKFIFNKTDLAEQHPDDLRKLQDLSQQLGLIAGQIEEIGRKVCLGPEGKVA